MARLVGQLRERSRWEGIWYLTLLIILPAFIGIPTVLWLVSHSPKNGL